MSIAPVPPRAGSSKLQRHGLRRPKLQISPQDARLAHERIVRRHVVALGIVVGHGHVEAQHLAEQRLRILREVERIVARPAVAHADVEKAVGTEREVAAVVIRERLRDDALAVRPPQIEAARRIRAQRVRRRSREPRDHRVAREVDEVHEDAAARRVVRARTRVRAGPARRRVANDGGQIEEVGRLDTPLFNTRMRPSC